MKKKIRAILAGIIVTMMLFFVLNLFITSEINQQKVQIQMKTMDKISMFRNHLEYSLLTRIHSTSGIVGFIELNSGITHKQFQTFAKQICDDDKSIRNISLMKNTVIKDVYPYKANKKAIGTDLLKVPTQRNSILDAIKRKNMVVDAPVNLVEGDVGIINRIPIYIDKGNGKKSFWGMVSIVLKKDVLFDSAFPSSVDSSCQIGVRSNKDHSYKMLWGSASAFNKNAIRSQIMLPNCTWEIAAVPANALYHSSFFINLYRIISFLVAAAFGIMLTFLINTKHSLHDKSYTDSLTGLPNRSFFYSEIDKIIKASHSSNNNVAVLFLDIDKFKDVNDTYGHYIGDILLKSVSERLKASLCKTDVIARLGGDEFAIIIPKALGHSDVEKIVNKIRGCFNQPFDCNGNIIKSDTSIGYSIYPIDAKNRDELMICSDKNMYKDKQRKKTGKSFHIVGNVKHKRII